MQLFRPSRNHFIILILIGIIAYVALTVHIEHKATVRIDRAIERIKQSNPFIQDIRYSKLTASPLSLYNRTIALRDVSIRFKKYPNNPLIISQFSLIAAHLKPDGQLGYLSFAIENAHFQQPISKTQIPAALLQYGFFGHLIRSFSGKTPYFYNRVQYDANAQRFDIYNQVTLRGSMDYREHQTLSSFRLMLKPLQQSSNFKTLLSTFFNSARHSKIDQYTLEVNIPKIALPNAVQQSLTRYLNMKTSDVHLFARFNLKNHHESAVVDLYHSGKQANQAAPLLKANLGQIYQQNPSFNYGYPPLLTTEQGKLVFADITFYPMPTLLNKAKTKMLQEVITAALGQHQMENQTLLTRFIAQKEPAFDLSLRFTPKPQNNSAYLFLRQLAQVNQLMLQYADNHSLGGARLQHIILPWLQHDELKLSASPHEPSYRYLMH